MDEKNEPLYYMIIHLDYQKDYVLPIQDGLTFLSLLKKAEYHHDGYNKTRSIGPPKTPVEEPEVKLITADLYKELKMAHVIDPPDPDS